MIDWIAVKKASDDQAEMYLQNMLSPITPEEASRLAMARDVMNMNGNDWLWHNGTFVDSLQNYNPGARLSVRNGKMYLGGNRIYNDAPEGTNRGELAKYTRYKNGAPVRRRVWYDEYGNEISEKDALASSNANYSTQLLDPSGKVIIDDAETSVRADPEHDFRSGLNSRALDRLKSDYGYDEWEPTKESYDRLVSGIDPDGLLARNGLTPKFDENGKMTDDSYDVMDQLLRMRTGRNYLEHLRSENPYEYDQLARDYIGVDPLEQTFAIAGNVMNEQQRAAMRAAKRWGSNQVTLTPEQYAYYDAKQQYNANPGSDPYYQRWMNAYKTMKPNDLSQVKKYSVQQRMMNTPQPNGMPKTPAQLNQEWSQENKRRQRLSNEMYMNERQGLKNRTGVQPTPVKPW